MPAQTYNQIVKNIKGSFAVEGMSLGSQSLRNLKRLSNGSITISELVKEITEKYAQKEH